MIYYYPNNLAEKPLIAKYWSITDLCVIAVLFTLSILSLMVFGNGFMFIVMALYMLFSAKLADNGSLTKQAILYIRYLLTDILIFYWR